MSLTLVTAPTVYPVTESEVWAHLRLNLTGSPAVPADQAYVAGLTAAATAYLDGRDGILGRCLVEQTWDLKLDGFPCHRNSQGGYQGPYFAGDAIRVPLPPLRSVTSITYIDTAGASQTLASALYTVDAASEPSRIVPAYGESWPSTRDQIDAVTARFVAGYAPSSDSPPDYRANIPKAIKQSLLILIAEMYEHREAVNVGNITSEMPFAADALLAPYRVWEFG